MNMIYFNAPHSVCETDLVIGEFLLVMVERELVLLILQVDSPITHGCQLSGPREKHHTEGHYAGCLKTKTWG